MIAAPRRQVARQAASIIDAGLVDPAVTLDAAVELEVRVELGDIGRLHGGKLPVVEDAGLVQLLLELRADAVELGQVVRSAARGGQTLELLASSAAAAVSLPGAPRPSGSRTRRYRCPMAPWPREMPSMAARATRSQ